jgi:uncharacterized glyoxalase superfamily protein PhnB
MKFAYTIIYVPEVTTAVTFYENAFGLKRRFIHESGTYAEMESGETTLSFASDQLIKSMLPAGFQENSLARPPAGIEIAFTTADVPAAFAQAVAAGAIELTRPEIKPWGQHVAYVRDLNGVLVELASPMN